MNIRFGMLLSFLSIIILANCQSQNKITKNYLSPKNIITNKSPKITIVSALSLEHYLTDTLFKKIYGKSSYLELLEIQNIHQSFSTSKFRPEKLESFSSTKNNILPYRSRTDEKESFLMLFAYDQKIFRKHIPEHRDAFTLTTPSDYVPPKQFSFRKYMNSILGRSPFYHDFFKSRIRFLLYNKKSNSLIFDITVYSEWLPFKQHSIAWNIEQSYHFLIDKIVKDTLAHRKIDAHNHIFSINENNTKGNF
jgi:hypothetical protein